MLGILEHLLYDHGISHNMYQPVGKIKIEQSQKTIDVIVILGCYNHDAIMLCHIFVYSGQGWHDITRPGKPTP